MSHKKASTARASRKGARPPSTLDSDSGRNSLPPPSSADVHHLTVARGLAFAVIPTALLLLYSFLASSEKKAAVIQALGSSQDDRLEGWQTCDVFMAPTNISGTGWGVFAARDFQENELFNILPLFVPMEVNNHDPLFYSEHRLVKSTQLDDYVYGVYRRHLQKHQQMVLFGYEMVYNHHPTAQNVQFGLGNGYAQGFYAKKSARAGEQLFSSYGTTDGGVTWFEKRGMTMKIETEGIATNEQLDFLRSKYCSKIYAGPGRNSYTSLIPSIQPDRVAPFEAGLFNARAKVAIQPGDVIEQGPAILLYKPFIEDTALAPLGVFWENLSANHQQVVRTASLEGQLPIQYRGQSSDMKTIYRNTSIENTVFFPFAGRIGMVRRVDSSTHKSTTNCRLEINVHIDHQQDGGDVVASVELILIATQTVGVGQLLLMDLKPAGSERERQLLKAKLKEIGYSSYHLDPHQ